MYMKLDWIITAEKGALGTMPRPRGGEMLVEELRALREMGVDVLVSLLTGAEMWELGLTEEAEISRQLGMEFISFPVPDHHYPQESLDYLRLIKLLADRLRQ